MESIRASVTGEDVRYSYLNVEKAFAFLIRRIKGWLYFSNVTPGSGTFSVSFKFFSFRVLFLVFSNCCLEGCFYFCVPYYDLIKKRLCYGDVNKT